MGERGQIKIGGVYLYTHWKGHKLESILREALGRKERWSDGDYLARIIFETMIGSENGTSTGFGLGTQQVNLNYPLLEVDVAKQEVVFTDRKRISFKDFVEMGI